MEDVDLEYMKQLIAEYDAVVPALYEQLNFYKREYATLKRDIVGLGEENKALSQKLEECACNHMAITPYSFKDTDFIDNLKNQLSLSLKEKDSVVELWRTSMTRIDYLENELKIYSAGSDNANKSFINKVKKTYENEVKNLRAKLKESNVKLLEATNISKTSLEDKQDELKTLNRAYQEIQANTERLSEELSDLQLKQEAALKANEALKSQLAKEEKKVEKTNLENYNAKLKVAEACHIIEAALIEKDAALLREKSAQDEIAKLAATINEIVQETQGKVKLEVTAVREDFMSKVHCYKLELKKCQQDLAMKSLELEKRNEWCKQLENETEQLREGNSKVLTKVSKEKQAWSGKVELNKEKLVNCERRNAQLKQELKQLQDACDRSKQTHDDVVCTLEMEKKTLQAQIHTLENNLQLSNARFHQINTKVEDLNTRISSMDLQFKDELALKNAESERVLTERLNEVECVNAHINEELKAKLSTQINLNQKWKVEVRNVTEKLESKIHILKTELTKLRSKNAALVFKLEHTENKCLGYKENLKTLCAEFNTMANIKL